MANIDRLNRQMADMVAHERRRRAAANRPPLASGEAAEIARRNLEGIPGQPRPRLQVRALLEGGRPVMVARGPVAVELYQVVSAGKYDGRRGTWRELDALGDVEVLPDGLDVGQGSRNPTLTGIKPVSRRWKRRGAW